MTEKGWVETLSLGKYRWVSGPGEASKIGDFWFTEDWKIAYVKAWRDTRHRVVSRESLPHVLMRPRVALTLGIGTTVAAYFWWTA